MAFRSVQLLSHVRLFVTPWTAVHQLPCPSPTPGACSNSCPLSQWCHPTISSSVIPFSSNLQFSLASRSFPISQFFTSGGQSIVALFSASDLLINIQGNQLFSSAQSLSPVWFFVTPWTAAHQPPCPSPTPRACSNPCPSNLWCHPTITTSVTLFFFCPQSFLASESFPVSWLLAWGGQSIGVSASASVLPMNTQDWSPLGWTSWVSWQSKRLSRVFSNTIVQKHQFFGAQLSL